MTSVVWSWRCSGDVERGQIFVTFLRLAVARAISQSVLLVSYEVIADTMLEDPLTVSIPRHLAEKGETKLKRRVALQTAPTC